MKSLRTFLLLVASFAVAWSANAEQKSTFKMKDGSIIYGRIIGQCPGVNITIEADSARIFIADKNLLEESVKKVKYENLSRQWQIWALKKKALQGNANGRYMELYTIRSTHYTLPNAVKLKAPKEDINKYYQAESTIHKVKWNEVVEIVRTETSSNSKTQIDDEVVTLIDLKTYRGTIVSQTIDKHITLKTSNGTYTFFPGQVVETRKVPHQAAYKLSEIADYTNTIVLTDGTEKKGFIVALHYGTKEKDKYVTLQLANGKTEKIQNSKISELRTSYKKTTDETYKSGQIYVNEFLINKAKTKTEGSNLLYVEKSVYPFPEGIVITFKSKVSQFQNDWYLVALEPLEIENGKITQGLNPEIKQNNAIKPSVKDMVNGVNSISFNYLSPGFYALVSDTYQSSYIIKIVK